MVEQHLVEITARYLIRVIGLRSVAVLEVELRSGVGTSTHNFAAVFFYEPGSQKFFVQPEPAKGFHAERQQRLADVKARELFPLEKNHPTSGSREQRRGRAAGRSASYDRDVVDAAGHRFDLSKLSRFW